MNSFMKRGVWVGWLSALVLCLSGTVAALGMVSLAGVSSGGTGRAGNHAQADNVGLTGSGRSRLPILPRLLESTGSGVLSTVQAISASNAWAAGGDSQGAIIVHWNGAIWSYVATHSPGSLGYLNAISASSVAKGWAAGS